MIIYITEPNETHSAAIDLLKQNGHIIALDLKEHTADTIDVLFIRTFTKATKEYLEQFTNLKYILRIGVGVDNIDVEECKARNITIINAPGSNANAVAEYVIGVMIMALRDILPQSDRLQNKGWREKKFIGSEIKNKTIGIVGCGAIGKLIAKKLQNFEIKKNLGYDPFLTAEQMQQHNIEKAELDILLKTADIITLHLPLTPETTNLIKYEIFKNMKRNAVLINAARGGIVNESDLIKALNENLIKSAALDVFENEPAVRNDLLDLENIVITPHIAGYTEEADAEMSLMPVRKLLEMIK